MSNKIAIILSLVIFVTLAFLAPEIKANNDAYNYHMCVEVYGLNKDCK